MPIAPAPRAFDALRAAIEKIQAGGRAPKGSLPFGVDAVDHRLPNGGLAALPTRADGELSRATD